MVGRGRISKITDPIGISDTASLAQTLSGVTAGQAWFYSMRVDLAGTGPSCSVTVATDQETLFSYSYGANSYHNPMNASGIFAKIPSLLKITPYCTTDTSKRFDVRPSFDNIALSIFTPSIGTRLLHRVAMQVLSDNGFDNGDFAPYWNTSQTSGRADFSVTSGQALVTFARVDPTLNSPTAVYQTLSRPVEAGLNVTLTADVNLSIPIGGATCSLYISTSGDTLWTANAVTASQLWHVNVNQTLTASANVLNLGASCSGSSIASVSWDNTYLTGNAF